MKKNNGKKIEQKVILRDNAQSGPIVQIGEVVKNVIPAQWQDDIWNFVKINAKFLAVLVVLEVALVAAYFTFRQLYLIMLWYWALAAVLLTSAAYGWYAWGWKSKERARLAFSLLASLALGGLLGRQAWQIAFPPVFDAQVFGIAVAEMGEGAGYLHSPRAREVSGQVYEHLCVAIRQEFAEESDEDPCAPSNSAYTTERIELRRVGVIQTRETARTYGQRLNADVVIWGQLLTTSQNQATIRFEVLETTDRAINPEFPLVLPVTTTSTEFISEVDTASDSIEIKEVIADQTTILAAFTLGLAAYLDRDFTEAVLHFEAANSAMADSEHLSDISSDGGRCLLSYYLGKANHSVGEIEQGQIALADAQCGDPQEPAVPLSLALGYASLGETEQVEFELDGALDLLTTWLRRHPDDTAALFNRGVLFQMRHEFEFAAQDFEEATQIDREFYIAYISLGQVQASIERYDEAENSLQTAIELAAETGADASWAHLNLARVYQFSGDPESAKAEYRRAIELAPQIDWMYFYYAEFLEGQEEMDAALVNYEKVAEVSQSGGWAYGHLAGFLKRRGLLPESAQAYRQATRDRPEDALLHTYLGEVYFELGDAEQAFQEFEEGVERGEEIAYVFASYAQKLFESGDYEKAARMFESARERDPDNFLIMMNLAQSYLSSGDLEQAESWYMQIMCLDDGVVSEEVLSLAGQQLDALGADTACDFSE